MNTRHIKLIAGYAGRFAVRGGAGLVFLLVALLFGLIVANAFVSPIEQVTAEAELKGVEVSDQQAVDGLLRVAEPAVKWVLGRSYAQKIEDDDEREAALDALDTWSDHLLREKPALLSAILIVLLWGWPFLVAFGSFNTFSGDIQNRGLRYQLIRTDRSSILWGRILGNLSTYLLVLLLVLTIVGLYIGGKLDLYGWGDVGSSVAWGFVILMLVSLPYVALASWISAVIDSPFASLTVISLVIGGVPLAALFGSMQWEHAVYVKYLLPWGYQTNLLHPEWGTVALAALGCLGHAALFFFLAHRKFLKRDL